MKNNDLYNEKTLEMLSALYSVDIAEAKRYAERLEAVINGFKAEFSDKDVRLFSAPGRTEVGGNHTDHQHGHVLAAAVNLDIVAAAAENKENVIRIKSEGYDMSVVKLDALEPDESEFNTTTSLIRGIAAEFKRLGYEVRGFDAYMTSSVLKGSGLSSSAALEVIVGTMINCLFCGGSESAVKIAQIGQVAENVYFGKPSGLMDQMASSVGGFVSIDFEDTEKPAVEKVDFDLGEYGYSLCVVDTGGNHADLTPDYAAITKEMGNVSAYFGKKHLRELKKEDIIGNAAVLRERFGDRAVLRSLHFFDDDRRAVLEAEALKKGDIEGFLSLVNESGLSSFMRLQNGFSCGAPAEQGLSLAMAVASDLLKGRGACRIHGGGFAGTIQAFVPNDALLEFKNGIEAVFGEGKCYMLSIRPVGGVEIV